MADRDHHGLVRDQVFRVEADLGIDDLGAPFVAEACGELDQFSPHHGHSSFARRHQGFQLLDGRTDLGQFFLELLDLQSREAGQAHVEDGLGLFGAELEALAQAGGRFLGVLGSADDLHDLVDVVDGDLQPLEDVLALSRHPEAVLGALHDHRVPVIDEVPEDRLEVHHPGNPVHERQHDDAERALHLGVLVELVQHDLGDRVALQLDHDPNAVTRRRLVSQVRDVFDATVTHELGDLLDEARLVHHERDLGDDQSLASARPILDVGPRAHDHATPSRGIRFPNPGASVDEPPGREVRSRDVLQEVFDGCVRVLDQTFAGRDDLAEIVGRDVRGHPHGDA